MKIRFSSWFKNHPVSYIGLGLCLIVTLTAIAYPVLAQSDPTSGGAIGGIWGNFGVDGLLDALIKAIFSGLAFIGMALAALVGNFCIWLINSIILPGQNSILFSSQIKDAWQAMLNLANILFFVSLVAFAIMIITRTGGYNLKKAVTSLITTVVLANLSYQLVLVMVEAGDALRNLAASLLGFDAGQWETSLKNLNQLWDPALIVNIDANVVKYILASILGLAMGLIVTFVLFRLVFILVERAIQIAVLTIFGPIQIALGVLPQKDVQGLAGNWFGSLVKWVLVLPLTFVVLAIGQRLAPTNSLVALREFIITSWDPSTGPSTDQLTGTGDIFFGLISLGIMFAATKTPDMLKVTLSGFGKFFTDFADKTVLQKGVGTLLKTGATYAGVLGSAKFPQLKALRGIPAKLRSPFKSAQLLSGKQTRDAELEAIGVPHRAALRKIRNAAMDKFHQDPNFISLQQQLDKMEEAGQSKTPAAKAVRRQLTDLKSDYMDQAKKAAYAADPFLEGRHKEYEPLWRQKIADEARLTTRDEENLLSETESNAKKLAENKAFTMKTETEGLGILSRLFKPQNRQERVAAAELIDDIMHVDPNKKDTYGIPVSLKDQRTRREDFMHLLDDSPWDDLKGMDLADYTAQILENEGRTSKQKQTNARLGDDDEPETPAADRGPAVSPASTPTEAFIGVGAARRQAEAFEKLAEASGITNTELADAIGDKTSIADKLDGMFTGLDDEVKNALLPQLQTLVNEVDGFGHVEAQMLVENVGNDSKREDLLNGLDDLKAVVENPDQELINNARSLANSADYQSLTDPLAKQAMARERLGADITPGAVQALASAISPAHLSAIQGIAQTINGAKQGDAATITAGLNSLKNEFIKQGYATNAERADSGRTQAGEIDHKERESIIATAANIPATSASDVSQLATAIVDKLEKIMSSADNSVKEVELSNTSISKLAGDLGNNVRGNMDQLGKLIGRDQSNPLTRIGGEDQGAAKVYAALNQLINLLQRNAKKPS